MVLLALVANVCPAPIRLFIFMSSYRTDKQTSVGTQILIGDLFCYGGPPVFVASLLAVSTAAAQIIKTIDSTKKKQGRISYKVNLASGQISALETLMKSLFQLPSL